MWPAKRKMSYPKTDKVMEYLLVHYQVGVNIGILLLISINELFRKIFRQGDFLRQRVQKSISQARRRVAEIPPFLGRTPLAAGLEHTERTENKF